METTLYHWTLPTAATAPRVPALARRRRILVADDNRDAASSLTLMLQLMGHEVFTAYDGLEALELAEGCRPDALLLDIGMPRLNGFDVARRVREETWGRGIMIIAITGWGADQDRQRSHESGFDFHIVKPANPMTLQRILSEPPPPLC